MIYFYGIIIVRTGVLPDNTVVIPHTASYRGRRDNPSRNGDDDSNRNKNNINVKNRYFILDLSKL